MNKQRLFTNFDNIQIRKSRKESVEILSVDSGHILKISPEALLIIEAINEQGVIPSDHSGEIQSFFATLKKYNILTNKSYPKQKIQVNTNPTILYLELTKQCNLNCAFCYSQKTSSSCLNISQIEEIAKWVQTKRISKIVLGGSENVLHPKFERALHILSNSCNNIALATSGYYPSDKSKFVREAFNHNIINQIQISIDSGVAHSHDRIRRVDGAWNAAIAQLKSLSDYSRVNVSTFLTNIPVRELISLYELLIEHKITSWTLFFNPTNYTEVNYTNLNNLHSFIYETVLKNDDIKLLIHDPIFAKNYSYPIDCACRAGALAIDADLNIRACPFSKAAISLTPSFPAKIEKVYSDVSKNYKTNCPFAHQTLD